MNQQDRTALAAAMTVFGLGLGAWWWLREHPSSGDRVVATGPPPDDLPIPGAVPGVTVLSGARLSARQWAFLADLRRAVPSTVPITVTSGLRSYAEQARLMWEKVQAGEPLSKLYGQNVESTLMSSPFSQWEALVRGMYRSGVLDPDGHVGGGAVDLRTRDLISSQVDALISGVTALGARPLLETTPPHLHVSRLPRP